MNTQGTAKHLVLTEKGRALIEQLQVAEARLAAVWREPFEQYHAQAKLAWLDRRFAAQAAYDDLWHQI